MKKIFTLFFLAAAIFATAQEADTMYVYKGGNIVQRIPVSGIDSVTFALPVVPEGPQTPVVPPVQSEYEYVDLGLPSGIMWATCNVGATKPEEYGGYYAWGEVEEKDNYAMNYSTYKWCNGSSNTLTKYVIDGGDGVLDYNVDLDPEDDAAYVERGGTWRIPTLKEAEELHNNCTWEATTLNGVGGYRATSKINGNSIFFPNAGCRQGTSVYAGDSYGGFYWTTKYYDSNNGLVYYFSAKNKGAQTSRPTGCTVRPVCSAPANCTISVSGNAGGDFAIVGVNANEVTVSNGASVTVTASPDGDYGFAGWYVGRKPVSRERTYTFVASDNVALVAKFTRYNDYEYVDLGLPSGLKWATCNVGATKPEEYGGYYAWGETSTKSEYNDGNYKWESLSKTTKYCLYSNHDEFDGKMHLEPGDDVANVKWGGSWRMPLKDDMNELRYYCTWEWTSLNGVEGCRVTGPNGNSIFLPAAGMCWQYGHTNEGKLCYWIGTVLEYRGEYSECAYAYCLFFGSDTAHRMSWDCRYRARTVRPVTE